MTNQIFQNKLNESLVGFKFNRAIEYGSRLITYDEIDKRSNYIANWIIARGFKKETFIGLLMDNRSEFILTMIGILKARCVFIPLDTAYPKGRLETIIKSTDIGIIITDRVNFRKFSSSASEISNNGGVEFVVIDDLFSRGEKQWHNQRPDVVYTPEDKIYIYFTSGTTGTPKAVIGKNRSLLHFINWEIKTFGIDETFRFSQFTTPGFDVFLRDILVPLCAGGAICIPENNEIILNSRQIVEWIDAKRINLIHCVPTLFALFNKGVSGDENFKSLKYILLAGEKVNPVELRKWYNRFGEQIQLVNLYGPTETTLAKMFHSLTKADSEKDIVPVGKPISGARIILLNENMAICDELEVGEVYIRTPYRSYGYYNAPELNKQKFIQNPFSSNPDGIIYRTGDLGRLLPDGNIELLGRIDRQVKIRGMRVELEEVESVLLEYPRIKEAVVIKRESSNGKASLAAFVTENTEIDAAGAPGINNIREHLYDKLPDYMVPANIKTIEKIPRKPNLKVDYDTLGKWLQEEKINYVPPRNDVEKKLIDIWTEILSIPKIGITNNFFELGGNSLDLMPLLSRIRKVFNVRISLRKVFNNPIIEMQAEVIRRAKSDNHASIEASEEKEYYALSSAQKRLYFLQQMDKESTAYNISQVVILEGNLDMERFEETFKHLIERHESLRTSLQVVEDEPVQWIHKKVKFLFEYYTSEEKEWGSKKINDAHMQNISDDFVGAFTLSLAPLLRVCMIKVEESRHILMLDMHHIISDGTSMTVLIKEFAALYQGETLPPLRLQYRDYAEWQKRLSKSNEMEKQEEYWLKQFEGEIQVLKMLSDYERPTIQTYEGDTIEFIVEKELTDKLKQLAKETGSTLYIVLLAVYNILLSKYTGQEDIIVGTAIAGRGHADLENIIGMFVNMLAMRNQPAENKTFGDFLQEVKKNTLDAYENQDYQFDELVGKLGLERNWNRNPLFDTQFTFHNIRKQSIGIHGLTLKPYEFEKRIIQFDLPLTAVETRETIIMTLSYLTSLFKRTTAEKMVKHYVEILEQVIEDRDISIKDIELSHALVSGKSHLSKEESLDFKF